jgi:hypothetical protein
MGKIGLRNAVVKGSGDMSDRTKQNTVKSIDLAGQEFISQKWLLHSEGFNTSSNVQSFLRAKIQHPHFISTTHAMTAERHEGNTLMTGRDRE